MSLEYEPSSEPLRLRISAKQVFHLLEGDRAPRREDAERRPVAHARTRVHLPRSGVQGYRV